MFQWINEHLAEVYPEQCSRDVWQEHGHVAVQSVLRVAANDRESKRVYPYPLAALPEATDASPWALSRPCSHYSEALDFKIFF